MIVLLNGVPAVGPEPPIVNGIMFAGKARNSTIVGLIHTNDGADPGDHQNLEEGYG